MVRTSFHKHCGFNFCLRIKTISEQSTFVLSCTNYYSAGFLSSKEFLKLPASAVSLHRFYHNKPIRCSEKSSKTGVFPQSMHMGQVRHVVLLLDCNSKFIRRCRPTGTSTPPSSCHHIKRIYLVFL